MHVFLSQKRTIERMPLMCNNAVAFSTAMCCSQAISSGFFEQSYEFVAIYKEQNSCYR
jgi:hypothetical protein